MIIDLIILGIILSTVGAICIYLRFCCDDMEVLSWLMFTFGIIITIAGILLEETPILCSC